MPNCDAEICIQLAVLTLGIRSMDNSRSSMLHMPRVSMAHWVCIAQILYVVRMLGSQPP